MFCPKCKAEYREGYWECADCKTKLVTHLPPEPDQNIEYVDFKEIETSFDPGDIAIIKSILDDNQIVYFIRNEYSDSLFGAAFPAKIMVSKNQVQEVKNLLKDFL